MPKTLEKRPDEGINQVNVSRALLHIVAQLRETQYTGTRSTKTVVQQADVDQHADLSDPASDVRTTQG